MNMKKLKVMAIRFMMQRLSAFVDFAPDLLAESMDFIDCWIPRMRAMSVPIIIKNGRTLTTYHSAKNKPACQTGILLVS
jgi:hypothetical protein